MNKTLKSDDYQFAQTILDSISAHVAILDENGVILETNRAWKKFAEQNSIQMRPDTLNINYLEVCERDGKIAGEFSFVANGIRKVISGSRDEFTMDYPCHSKQAKRWFYMRAIRASGPGPLRIVVSHENITALKLAEERMSRSEQDLLQEKRRLEEANTALKVLLDKREQDRKELEINVMDNIRQLVLPITKELAGCELPIRAEKLLTTLDIRLIEVTKPFLQRIAAIEAILTPQEIEMAALIREGLRSKDIADRLNISITTVNFHRRNLREKLQLRNTRKNLRSHLMSLVK